MSKIKASELKIYADLYKQKMISKKEFNKILSDNIGRKVTDGKKKPNKKTKKITNKKNEVSITGDKETDKILKQAGVEDIALMFKSGGQNTIKAGKEVFKGSKATYKAGKEGYAQAKVGAKKTKKNLKVGYAKSKVGAKKTKELSKKGLSATKKGLSATKGFLKRLSPSEIKKSKVKFDEKKKKKADGSFYSEMYTKPSKTAGYSNLYRGKSKKMGSGFGSVKLKMKNKR
tara:strand:- start:1695 stop:2384 length:690 start_codon:yes stop_codon:yes gene_type:complete